MKNNLKQIWQTLTIHCQPWVGDTQVFAIFIFALFSKWKINDYKEEKKLVVEDLIGRGESSRQRHQLKLVKTWRQRWAWGFGETRKLRISPSTPWWHLWIMYPAPTSDQLTQNLRASRGGVEDSGRVWHVPGDAIMRTLSGTTEYTV